MVPESVSISSLTVEVPADESGPPRKGHKKPRRVLHFSDGVLEEYSTDEDNDVEPKAVQHIVNHPTQINPKSLDWAPWFWYQTATVGSKTLDVCDYLGETLANFFGITSPKYQYEIEHFKQMQEEEEALKREHDLEMGGWVSKKSAEDISGTPSVEQPSAPKY